MSLLRDMSWARTESGFDLHWLWDQLWAGTGFGLGFAGLGLAWAGG